MVISPLWEWEYGKIITLVSVCVNLENNINKKVSSFQSGIQHIDCKLLFQKGLG